MCQTTVHRRYHKASSPDHDLYLLALRRLRRNRWPDWRIAQALSQLSAQQIRALEANACWNEHDVEDVMVPGAGVAWTARQVRYHRHRLRLRIYCRRHEAGNLVACRWNRVRQEVARRLGETFGWRILLVKGIEWSSRILRVLLALKDGELTLRELAVRLGLRPSRTALRQGNSYLLNQLREAGLVEVAGYASRAPRYRLTPAATPGGERLQTSIDLAGLAGNVA